MVGLVRAIKNYLKGNDDQHAGILVTQEHGLLRALVDTMPDLVFAKDVEGKFIVSNKTHARVLGKRTPQEVIGKTDADCFPPEISNHCTVDDMEIIRTGVEWFDREEMIVDQSDGKEKWFLSTKVPLRDKEGRIVGLVGICRDITERKRIETELNLFREKMVRAEQLASLGTVGATLAHELSQPLTILRLSLQQSLRMLKKTACPETIITKLSDCLTETSNASSIMERFRDLTRRPSKDMLENLDFSAIMNQIISVLKENAQRSKIRLTAKGFDNLPLIQANRADIEQIFFILIQNAMQAADGKKWRNLNITARTENEHAILCFSDDCGGMKPEVLDKIFEPFFTTKPLGQGTGLGLTILKDILSKYDGEIKIDSQYEKGTTFYIIFPVKQ